ncbi:MAG: PhoH family protein [Bacteroidales bacterium]
MGTKKNFVLDTNVILHDYNCLKKFEENDIYIPIIVMEELDKFKKGNDVINYNAREFIRYMDSITDDELFKSGASLGEGFGRLFVYVPQKIEPEVAELFKCLSADNRILSASVEIGKKHPSEKTILVSKDINLRMKARALGVVTEDYINDKVKNIDVFAEAQKVYRDFDPDLIDRFYASKSGLNPEELPFFEELIPNECFVMESSRASALARYNPFTDKIEHINKDKIYGIEPRNAEQTFAMSVLLDPEIQLVGLTGKAGTGKTLLALAAALDQTPEYKQILLARPIVALANKDLGFLPGDEKQKVAPYMQPLYDNLTVIKHQFNQYSNEVKRITEMEQGGQLVIEALAYIRGRSLSETFFIIDEAQNLTPHEVKTIITRAGEGTKVVFTGDIQQIDSPYLDAQSNGLAYMIDKMRGQKIFAHVNLIKGERSELSELAATIL